MQDLFTVILSDTPLSRIPPGEIKFIEYENVLEILKKAENDPVYQEAIAKWSASHK